MTPKEEKQLQAQIRRHINRTIRSGKDCFPGFRVEYGKTIFSDGAILCLYNYTLPAFARNGFYRITKKAEFVFDSAAESGVGMLHAWDSVIPPESAYTEEVDFTLSTDPESAISRLLAHLGSKGVILNLRYFLDLPRGLFSLSYLPHEKGGERVPVTLRRRIYDEIDFIGVLMPLAPLSTN